MKKYLLSIAVLMAATISFTSCDDDDDCPTCPPPATIVQNGVYVINEGSYYSQINGTLDFLGYDVANDTYSMTRNIFESVNGRSLGGTPNDALIVGDSVLCIAVADENRVEFVNTTTKKASAAVSIDSPRELAYESGSNYIYVSSYTGKVYKLALSLARVKRLVQTSKVSQLLATNSMFVTLATLTTPTTRMLLSSMPTPWLRIRISRL